MSRIMAGITENSVIKGIVDETDMPKIVKVGGPVTDNFIDDPWMGINVTTKFKVGDKTYSVLSFKELEQDGDVYGTYIFDSTDPKNFMDAVAQIDVYNNKAMFDKNHTGNPKNVWYLLPENIALALHNASFPAAKKLLDAQPIPDDDELYENENVSVIYIDGKAATKYARLSDAKADVERLRAKFPNRKIEIKQEVRGGIGGNQKLGETEAKKGADGKRCWKGKRYAGTVNGKDKCIPVKEGVIIGHDAKDPEVAILGGAGTMSLSRLKKKAHQEALQLADDIANGKYNASSYNMKQLHNTLNTIVAAEEEMKKLYFGEDYTGEFAAEKTPAINPYGGLKDRKFRGAISETPTDNPTGSSGEGGWRKYKPKSAGALKENTDELKAFLDKYPEAEDAMRNAVRHFEYAYDAMDHVAGHVLHKMPYAEFSKVRPALIAYFKKYGLRGDAVNDIEEDTAYAGGMGQGHSGESYRKFKPKSAGTFKESAILKGIKGA